MTISQVLRKLRNENREFVTSKELKLYCKAAKASYVSTINYFLKRKYVIRVFRGVFYLRSVDEIKLQSSKYNHLELVARGLEIKGVKNWYFGLHTALKLNNMTHESFAVEEVISDSLFRAKPIKIASYKFKFVKLSSKLFGFGIQNSNGLKFSDPEKTVLDFIYLWRQNGVPDQKIISDIADWGKGLSNKKLNLYAKNYPSSVRIISKTVVQR
jgi:hypothetical protein